MRMPRVGFWRGCKGREYDQRDDEKQMRVWGGA
jgi:hypothetical protein